MPVLRPFYVDSPSTWDEQEDSLDFSADPDQLHDKLPQPFRLVNKILESLMDNTWSRIESRQETRDAQARQKHLPKVEGVTRVQLPYVLHSLCTTPDSYLVVGAGDGGLLAFSNDDVTRPLYKFNIDKEYLKVQVSRGVEENTYIVTALSSAGTISLFGLTRAGFIYISDLAIEETVLNFELHDCSVAVSVVGNDDTTSVVVLQLPTSNWVDPLEEISSKRLQGAEEDEVQFAPPENKGRVRSPADVVPCSKNHLSEALVPILNTINKPAPLGRGLYHILPKSYFDNRRALLEKLPKYQGIESFLVDKTVHVGHPVFCGDSRMVIWWSSHHIATLHSLAGGDLELAEDNFIFCCPITAATSKNGLLGLGLEKGLVAVINLQDGTTLQSSLLSRSPVQHLQFVGSKLLAACQDGSVAVLSCSVGGSCAHIQHLSADTECRVNQLNYIPIYSNIAAVSLSDGKAAVVDVDSYRAVAGIDIFKYFSVSTSLAQKQLCVVEVDWDKLKLKFSNIHEYTKFYFPDHVVEGTTTVQPPEMLVYDLTENDHVIGRGKNVVSPSQKTNLSILSKSYFSAREAEKSARLEKLRHRWFQYTEELDCY